MPRRHFLTALLLAAFLGLPLGTPADEPPKNAKVSIHALSMEVSALRTLHQFQLTPAQLRSLLKLAPETSQRMGPRPAAQVSDEFRKTLAEVRDALIASPSAERTAQLEDKLDKLFRDEGPDLDDSIEIGESACKRAPEFLRSLSARQLAGYVSLYGDDFPDPHELLLDALEQSRKLPAKKWRALQADVAENVGQLVGGLDLEKAGETSDKVTQWLIQVRALKEEEFKAKREELEKEARQIAGNLGPLEVIRNQAEFHLAELLSNPRLEAAVSALLK
jgi:hypothetical protein